ncbi:MAG TPA: acyl-CoA dehydrogenase family protein [Burkholderiaceae bacterium]|nr:acyl-CoA dehydrogenase family protein [Burkholderiaceae bacterium]
MDIVAVARSLQPEVRARVADIERERTLPADLARRLARAGLFRTLLPARVGGLELGPLEALGSMEAIAEADASAGWCTMIGATSGLAAAWLDPAVAAALHDGPDTVTGGVFAPMGRAVEDGDDYVVDGRWAWCSGHAHCRVLALGCTVLRDGRPVAVAGGAPEIRMVYVELERLERLDGWHASGLAGTGSGEVAAHGLRVPRERSVALATDAPRDPGALYRMPPFGLLAQGIAWTMLGNARAAVDDLVELAGGKRPQGGRRTLAERAAVQLEVAKAVAALRAARAQCVDAVGEAWTLARAGDPPGLEARAALRLSATFAVRTAADVARAMYELGGGSSVYLSSPLQRRFRDAHVGTQHAMVGPQTWELAGRVLLGLPTDATLL